MSDLTSRVTKHSMLKRRRLGRSYDPIKIVDRLLHGSLEVNDRVGLLTWKINELRFIGDKENALIAIQQYISLAPIHAEPWIILGNFYREELHCYTKAILVSNIAVEVAKLDGNFVRQSLGERMRTLLAAGEICEANECLRSIMKTDVLRGSVDIAFEDDFLNLPNAQKLDPDVVKVYRSLGLNYDQPQSK